jgi:hypothetical protein
MFFVVRSYQFQYYLGCIKGYHTRARLFLTILHYFLILNLRVTIGKDYLGI